MLNVLERWSLVMQAMKKADAEEAPAMKSMKAMKACTAWKCSSVAE